MRSRLALGAAALTLALGACGGPARPSAPAEGTATTASVSTATSAATSTTPGPTAATAGAPAPAPGDAVTASGRRTPWRAVVSGGVLRTAGPVVGERRVTVARSAWAEGVEFTGRDHGRPVSLVVKGGRCVDAAHRDTGQVAILTLGDRQLHGCAVSGTRPGGA